MNFDKAFDLCVGFLKANLIPALWGHPGIGKSALGRLLATKFDLEFIDLRLGTIEPVDLNGFIHKDMETATFDYLPWAKFPLEGTQLPIMTDAKGNVIFERVGVTGDDGKTQIVDRPKRYKGWLIMLDEVNTAPRQHLAAAYKFLHDRMIGQYRLHPNVRIMLGGNLVGEGLAGALPSPLVSRVVHIVMNAELTPSVCKILGPSISAFLTNHPKFIYQETTEPNTPFPTFRTWEMVEKYRVANGSTPLEALSCIVGTSAAVSYVSYAQQEEQLLDFVRGIETFPLDRSQELIDYMSFDVTLLERHLHRFPGEWRVIAGTKVQSMKDGTDTNGD